MPSLLIQIWNFITSLLWYIVFHDIIDIVFMNNP